MTATGVSKVEEIKRTSRGLRGTLPEELAGDEPAFSADARQLTKFHGIYAQDDRDVRTERKRQGLDPDHICMVRAAIPGGALTAGQYLAMDALADEVANGTLRITSRQGIQFHFVRKGDLRTLIGTLNRNLVTTLAACGDVSRNVMCCPAPLPGRAHAEVQALAEETARRLRPRTRAYYELWVDGERAATVSAPNGPVPGASTDDGTDDEPLYGPTYLPRKFKVGFAAPGDNCVDAFAQDVGVAPVVDGDRLVACTLLVGGGMGRSHSKPETFPRLADPLTTVAPDEVLEVIEAIVAVQRDHGDRADREHARFKYLVHDWGVERVRAAVAERLGRELPPPEPVHFDDAEDHLGWHEQADGRWFLGVKVENGRVKDDGDERVRAGLRAVVARFGATVRLTAREDLLLADLDADDRTAVEAVLADHGVVPAERWAPVERVSFACPALPTCGLALAESERALPGVLTRMAAALADEGLAEADIHVRMTGCPNGCARPYTAEVGLVGRGKDRYDIHLGGEPVGIRLNTVFAENVPGAELVHVLRPVLAAWRDRRDEDERFGDWCHRAGVDALRAELGTEQWVRRRRERSAG